MLLATYLLFLNFNAKRLGGDKEVRSLKENCNFGFGLIAYAVMAVILLGASPRTSGNHGIVTSDLDRSVKPGDNFYQFANGEWLKRTVIPPDRASVSVFSILDDIAQKRTSDLIQEIAKSKASAGSGTYKIAALYNSYMDEATIDTKGLAPLKPHLDEIAKISDKQQLARALGETLRADVDALNNTNFHTSNIFGLWVAPDFNDSDHYTAYLMQGGLALPDREYYLSEDEHMRDLRTRYQAHVATMFKLANLSDAEMRAASVFKLEHAIAEKHWTLAEDQDVHKANNPWIRSDFTTKASGLDWNEYFSGAGLAHQSKFIVWQPSALTGESALVASAPLEDWKNLLAFHLIEDYAGVLPKALSDEWFEFFGKTLTGTAEQRPRQQRAVIMTDALLGDEVGKLYAERYFSSQAKARAQAMVANIIAAFHKRVEALAWMTPQTKGEALKKLGSLYVGIGYPENWHEYRSEERRVGKECRSRWSPYH